MALAQIGNERWDFVETGGREVELPEPVSPDVALPCRWRLFGPLGADTVEEAPNPPFGPTARSRVEVAIEKIKAVPDRLEVDGRTLEGRDVVLRDGTLDLGALFGGHEKGQQAFLLAELNLDQDAEVAFGAGCDWWMRWWLNGEIVLDTMAGGNEADPIGHADHCFRRSLAAGRHMLAVQLIAGTASWVFKASVPTPCEQAGSALNAEDPELWVIAPRLGKIRPPRPRRNWQYVTAIRTDECLADVTVECDYRLDSHAGTVGIVLGAQDSGHYYYAYVPLWGQLWRARAFYAAIGYADGSGCIRNLKMELMPNVPCHWNVWRTLKVERRGSEIQMWVNGVKGPRVRDDRYGAGRVGVAGFSNFLVRDLRVQGSPAARAAWKAGDFRGRPWFHIEPDLSLGDFQGPGQLVQLGDEIILPMVIGRNASCHRLDDTNSAHYLYRSRDGGRTWRRYGGPLRRDGIAEGTRFVPGPGVIRAVAFDPERRRFTLRDSRDRALTWGEPFEGRLMGDWERDIFREGCWNNMSGFARLNDGCLLAVILHGYVGLYDVIPNHGQGTWGTEIAQPYCTLSHDQGLSWTEPVPMDNAALCPGAKPDSPCGGFSETAVAQLPDGKIVALARPYRSPFMWQTESNDGGRSWRQACYAPFSGAGGPQMVATRSGYLAIVKRGPGVGLHCSYDGGVNWDEGTMIDFPESFNGSAIETEPDVLLVVYPQSMDEIRPSHARAQLIRISPEGPEPVPR